MLEVVGVDDVLIGGLGPGSDQQIISCHLWVGRQVDAKGKGRRVGIPLVRDGSARVQEITVQDHPTGWADLSLDGDIAIRKDQIGQGLSG